MPFQSEFEASRGRPIVYKGKTLVMYDDFPLENERTIRFTFESCNAKWRQGVAIKCSGRFMINSNVINKGIVIWHDTAPLSFEFEVKDRPKAIEVKNVWDVGDGQIHSWHNGAAMIVEILDDGRRYYCNDGFADDDFDDVVFSLTRVRK